MWQQLPAHRFVLKTDVQSYYASIDHVLLMDKLAVYIPDRRVLNLIGQSLIRVAERGGLYWEHRRGIALGCPLSPLLGAFFLYELDVELERLGLFFVRYMDDILVLAPTRWKLRQAVKVVNEVLVSLRLAKHPDKTFIGRSEKGFDWLGYHIRPGALTMAAKTLEHAAAKIGQLYERYARSDPQCIARYWQRFLQWCHAGVRGIRVGLSKPLAGKDNGSLLYPCDMASVGRVR